MNGSHEEIRELIADFVRGSLKKDQRDLTLRHLEECAECREEAALIGGMLDLEVPEPGEEFWRTLPTAIREKAGASPASGTWLRALVAYAAQAFQPIPMAAMAALAVLVMTVSVSYRAFETDPVPAGYLVASAADYDEIEEGDIPALPIEASDAESYLQSGRFGSVTYLREFASLDKEELAELEQMLRNRKSEGG